MIYILLTIIHFVFDWMLQPRKVARKKGRGKEGFEMVCIHILINIIPYLLISCGILYFYGVDIKSLGIFFNINFWTHFLIDIYLPKGKNERQMINWTALDQILHLCILFSSLLIIS